jgi:hypothetical protein
MQESEENGNWPAKSLQLHLYLCWFWGDAWWWKFDGGEMMYYWVRRL